MKHLKVQYLAVMLLIFPAMSGLAVSLYAPVFNPVPNLNIPLPELQALWLQPSTSLSVAHLVENQMPESTSRPKPTGIQSLAVLNDRSVDAERNMQP